MGRAFFGLSLIVVNFWPGAHRAFVTLGALSQGVRHLRALTSVYFPQLQRSVAEAPEHGACVYFC